MSIQPLPKKRGRKPGQVKAPRTDIKLKVLKLDGTKDYSKQLAEYRKFMNISLSVIAKQIGFHPSNVYHFENSDSHNSPFYSKANALTPTALKYAKALGAIKIEITL